MGIVGGRSLKTYSTDGVILVSNKSLVVYIKARTTSQGHGLRQTHFKVSCLASCGRLVTKADDNNK